MAENKRILIADDSATIRLFLQQALERWSYSVVSTKNGEEARDVLMGENPPRMVILDWEMPGITGLELCRLIKQEKQDPYTYILMLTTNSTQNDVIKGFDAGADDYLIKPFHEQELRARIRAGFRVLDYEREYKEQSFKTLMECYQALTALAETRDQETGEHLKRIPAYSTLIARSYGCSEDFIKKIDMFSPLHDIGKVGIPDGILHAPRQLTEHEFGIIKTHTTLGWKILKGRHTLEMAAEIALTHHENWNGSGYPQGLKGKNIPLSGRIVAIADVYDALSNRRAYKEAWSLEEAVDFIISESGKKFDPEIVECFKTNKAKMEAIFNHYSDPKLRKS